MSAQIPTSLKPAVQASLRTWHEMVAAGDLSRLSGLLHDEGHRHDRLR
jgi:hypothetical protein